MPTVTVRYFAVLRERRGCEIETVEVAEGATIGELYRTLFPPGPAGALPVGYARNHAWAAAGDRVVAGDEIAFLPPLGGG